MDFGLMRVIAFGVIASLLILQPFMESQKLKEEEERAKSATYTEDMDYE